MFPKIKKKDILDKLKNRDNQSNKLNANKQNNEDEGLIIIGILTWQLSNLTFTK